MSLWQCAFGPKLFCNYGESQKLYEANILESFGEQILGMLSLLYNLGYYTSPLLLTFLYHRGYFITENIGTAVKLGSSLGVIIIMSLCFRAVGRQQSSQYIKFIKTYEAAKVSKQDKRSLEKFDYDFKSWDVDFKVVDLRREDVSSITPQSREKFQISSFRNMPCDIVAYLAIHTFGIRMIYPGSIKLLQKYMRPILLAGRTKLVEECGAKRFKIQTIDNNHIDTVFVDNKNKSSNGNILVICSEGNAGFYEIGIMSTPLALNYSVIGWNHPGFEASSGDPYPAQEKNAVNAVILFAVHKLGFKPEDIVLYGWSIGGFSTLWGASCHPNVRGVVLDATFDDVLHLAKSHMPASVSSIVEIGIRKYCNLNNTGMIQSYEGPITIIRRTEDEIIAENGIVETNRGNFLLINLLKYRYPNIFPEAQEKELKVWLASPVEPSKYLVNDELNAVRLKNYISYHGRSYPMLIGEDFSESARSEMAMFLVHKHFRDYKSTHCTPLPPEYFKIPWDINKDR